MSQQSAQAWEMYADAILQREALLCRVGEGVAPRDFAGMFVDHAEVDRILRRLPGLDGPEVSELDDILCRVDPVVAEHRRSFEEFLTGDSRFAQLVRSAALDTASATALALAAAVEMHPGRQRLVMYLQDSVALPRPTFYTLSRILPDQQTAAEALAPGGPLTRARLTASAGDGPWAQRMLVLSEEVIWYLMGHGRRQAPGLPAGTYTLTSDAIGEFGFVLVPGGDRSNRHHCAARHLQGSEFLVCRAPEDEAKWDAVIREATLAAKGVILDLETLSPEAADHIAAARHLTWGLCSPTELVIESLPDRRWREIRPPDTADDLVGASGLGSEIMGRGHLIDQEKLRLIERARIGSGGDEEAAVRRVARGHLEGLAVRVPPRRSWEDLVVHDEQKSQLRELSSRYRNRNRVHQDWGFRAVPSAGLVAAFAGPSGTGKTLAAEVIAGDLGLEMYKIDLSAVVSKYIGETEKNLERIFGGASMGNVVLFFDEADALFGKRSEVSDAHDRYANIEVSYLLQRLESYDGLVIMATNLQGNMDQAFLRRIHVMVEFPVPDENERRSIWALSFPPSAPTEPIDIDFLAAQFKLSGGSIRNAAVGAAFAAAEVGGPITMDLVILSIKREYQKLGRLLTEDEFDRYFDLVNDRLSAAVPFH